jgi:hypothetical protein
MFEELLNCEWCRCVATSRGSRWFKRVGEAIEMDRWECTEWFRVWECTEWSLVWECTE